MDFCQYIKLPENPKQKQEQELDKKLKKDFLK